MDNLVSPLKNTTFDFAPLQGLNPTPSGRIPEGLISALGSNFNPQNTQYLLAVKIFVRLELRQNSAFFKGLLVS